MGLVRTEDIELSGGRFHVEVQTFGDGPPLCYLHGIWDGEDNPLVAALAEHYTVTAPQLPGFGATTGEGELRDVHEATLFFLDLLDAIGFRGGPIVGDCLGAMFAAELAIVQPERFSSVVLLSPFGLWSDEDPGRDFFVATPAELELALFGPTGRKDVVGNELLMPGGATEPEGLTPEASTERQIARVRSLSGAARFLWPIPDRGLARRAHRLPERTLIVWGSEDGICPPSGGTSLARIVKGSTLVTLEGAGHLPHYQLADETQERVLAFLAR